MRRFFYFLLSFCFFIGGTLAVASAASVEAVELDSDDSGISVTSIDVEGETSSLTLYWYCMSSSGSVLSSGSGSSGTLFTVPSGTEYLYFYYNLSSNSDFVGYYIITYSSLSFAGYTPDSLGLRFNDSNNTAFSPVNPSRIYYDSNTISYSFELYHNDIKRVYTSIYFSGEVSSTVSMYLPSGSIYSYSSDDLEQTNSLISTSNSLLNTIITTLTSLPQAIIDLFISAMKNLFIPSDDYFSSLAADLYTYFEEKLGILFLPFDVLIQLCNALIGGNEEFVITFPAFELTVQGTTYTLWAEYEFDYYELKDQFPQLFNTANIIFTVLFAGWVLDFARHTYDKAVGAE